MPDLVIRALDPANDADMDGFQDVYAAAELAEDADASLYSRADGVAMLANADTTSLFDAFGAFLGEHMVAEAILMGSLRDNLDVAQLLVWVDPQHTRRGYGTRLLGHVEEQARTTRGRTILRVQARVGDRLERNRRFAEGHGYSLAMTEVERRLPLPVDPGLLDRLAAEAATHHTDYEILSFLGPIPDELRASYLEVENLLVVEMPHGDLEVEPRRNTVADLDALDRERAAAGRTSVSALAVHQSGVVAFTGASVPSTEFRHVDQYGTLVHPDHRGHRLGMAVKCAQLRLLSERYPDRDYIGTSNAETNAHMVAINVALGFEIHQVWGEFEKRLDRGRRFVDRSMGGIPQV